MMLLALLLSACSGTENKMQEALHFRTSLLEAQSCQFTAELTAQGETEVYACTLACEVDNQGTVTVTVVEPEEIAGIMATVTREGAQVEYDGVRLHFGELSGSVTPVGTPGLLYAAWTSGYIAASGSENGTTLTRYLLGTGSEERQVDTWFDANGVPVSCDVTENGVVVVSVQLRDWQVSSTAPPASDSIDKVPANPPDSGSNEAS